MPLVVLNILLYANSNRIYLNTYCSSSLSLFAIFFMSTFDTVKLTSLHFLDNSGVFFTSSLRKSRRLSE